jgi:hypothetical protein
VVKVRLWGIDAPEFDQPYGVKARDTAVRYIARKTVGVQVEDVDRYGRAVAEISVRGGNLGQMLVQDGLAWHYNEYAPNATQLARLERQTRNAGRGCGHRRVRSHPGRGETARVAPERRRQRTGIAAISTRSPKHSGSLNGTNRGTRMAWMGTGKRVKACPMKRGRGKDRPAPWQVESIGCERGPIPPPCAALPLYLLRCSVKSRK